MSLMVSFLDPMLSHNTINKMNHSKPNPVSELLKLLLFWLYVSIPLTWGIWSTLQKTLALFN